MPIEAMSDLTSIGRSAMKSFGARRTAIHVCSLARLHETVEATGARHVVSLLGREDNLSRPAAIERENHLWLQLHDISERLAGYVMPDHDHVTRLITFVRRWRRDSPLVVHCYAGVSRSTAAAFVTVCALSPREEETAIALSLRRASPSATPNIRIVALADEILGREGRMIRAVEAIGRGVLVAEAEPFELAVGAD
jgi:predicted protein tyrosine phosphatase